MPDINIEKVDVKLIQEKDKKIMQRKNSEKTNKIKLV
jgi:hypothetical protein